MISTFDSPQGMERRLVIISLKRSKARENIGFLTDNRRLNVATSRAHHSLIVIGDSSTVCTSKFVRTLWRASHRTLPGTVLVTIKPISRHRDIDQEQEYQERT